MKALSGAIAALYQPTTRSQLPAQVIRVFEGFFGSEIVTYNEFPQAGAPFVLSNNGFEKETPILAQLGPHLFENPLIAKLAELKTIPGLRVTDEVSMPKFRTTEIYNEFYRKIGGDYQMACGFESTRPDETIGIALNQKLRDFSDDELYLFNLLVPHAQCAYQLCHTLATAREAASLMKAALDGHHCGVIDFDGFYRVVEISRLAEEISLKLFGSAPRPGAILPDELLQCVLRLKGTPEPGLSAPRRPITLAIPDGSAVLLRLVQDAEQNHYCLLFEAEPGVPGIDQLERLGLTSREAEVVSWLLQGKTNWETGTILGISQRTTEKHVENIFAKLQVNDRRHLPDRIRHLVSNLPP